MPVIDCPYCDETFETKSQKINHVATKHKNDSLKARLAAVGIKFNDDKKENDDISNLPIKPLKDVEEEHRKKQQKFLNTPKTKPTQEDFNRIISAAREKIREAKTDHEHNHGISWRQIPKGDNGYRSASLVIDTRQKKFTKYWLLNAKQINGNGWGVDPETIDENIRKFVGKPFVITAKSWIPDSEYGESFEHPYIPTNNLRRIFMHQAKFAVGTIRRIIKDKNDDYYAMIEKFPRYAHMRDPPFCSPGIFQLNRNEPMDKIRSWEPLHLAGLELDPAYGAQVALLKGTCVGTENECHVQFRGAKLEMQTQCPIRNARKEKIKSRLADLNIETKEPHYNAKKVIDYIRKNYGSTKTPSSGSLLTPEGELLGGNGFTNHYGLVGDVGKQVGMKFGPKPKPHPDEPGHLGGYDVDDSDIHEFLKRTGMVRVQHFPRIQKTTLHIATKLTGSQKDKIRGFEADNPNGELGYAIGDKYEDLETGEGFRNLMQAHARKFGERTAQAEDIDSVFNMTYTKSKPTKVKKKILKAQIENFQLFAGSDAVVKAFKKKQKAVSGNYSTNGQEFFLFKNKIAEHSPKGLRVSNAGYDTPTTYKAIKQLGVRAEVRGGQTYIHNKPYKHGTFVTVPYDEVSSESLIKAGDHNRGETNETLTKLRSFRNTVMRKHNNLSQTSIQPSDQREINKITGVNTPIPKTTRATAVHHILYRRNVPGMQFNPNNGIPLDRKSHSEAHHFDRLKTSQVRIKIQNAKMKLMFAELIDKIETPEKVKINPVHGKVIADAYDKMEHTPDDPYTKTAYNALINETNSQYDELVKKGLKIDDATESGPYKSADEMHQDIEKNNHLKYFPTSGGFGNEEEINKDHPMLQPTKFEHKGKPLLANDVFRIVHDINGHHKGGRLDFSPEGEQQAYLQHKKMYSDLAQKALFTETAAQANYFAFGPNGKHNLENPEKAIFPKQKAGLIPHHIIHGNFHSG